MKMNKVLFHTGRDRDFDQMVAVLGTYCVQLARQIGGIMSIHLEWNEKAEIPVIAILFRSSPVYVMVPVADEFHQMCLDGFTEEKIKGFYDDVYETVVDAEDKLMSYDEPNDDRGPAPDPESLIIFAEFLAVAGYTAHLDESTTVKLVEVKRQLDVARLNDAIKICIERVHSAQRRWNLR